MSKIENILEPFNNQLNKDDLDKMKDLYKKIEEGSEFEIMFFKYIDEKNRMSLEHFLKILEFIKFRSQRDKLKLENIVSLDLNYTKKNGEVYRVTISGLDSINKYIRTLHMRKNHVIFSVLVKLSEKDKNISILKKVKEKENIVDITDYDLRVRLSKESNIDKKEFEELQKLDENTRDQIIFRYKQRVSLRIEDQKDTTLSIDLTNIKMSKNINRLEEITPNYELEIDLSTKKNSVDKKYFDTIVLEIGKLLKVIQQSNYIISRSLEKDVIERYKNLLKITSENITSLDGRRPQSLEVQHVVDQLPDKYAVTDKADGERYFLIIYKNHVFLISDLLNVKNMGIQIPAKQEKYNDSILDGELIFIRSQNRYIFLAFDCLVSGSEDIRQVSNLMERLKYGDEIVENCFVLKGQKGFKLKDYEGSFDIDKIMKFHNENIGKFMELLNHDIGIEKQKLLIRRKYFIPVLGGQHNEIFKYSELLWNKIVYDKDVKCPYILDGLIYQPTIQKYITSVKESKFLDYKWKPEEKNSIDFYVLFERSKDTNKIVTLFDNSREEDQQIRGKPYKILKLHVGKVIKGIEQPVLFEPEKDSIKYLAYIYLQDGEARDIEGNIIQDGTVVEFYYNNDPNIPDKNRWVPMRTRLDKTESVQRFGKKYGNYVDIAYKVWRSIRNPFTMNDVDVLSKDNMYEKQIGLLRGKIDHSIILSERKENIYYQKRTNLAKPMRNFHNWIKSILIYTNANPVYQPNNESLTVLDINCGRGGHLMEFYYVQVEYYVGFDRDNNSLISPVDGAVSRFNQLRKTHPNFPRMFFIHADGGALLNYEDQVKTLGNMTTKNKEIMEKFFSKDDSKRTKFDRINCQFSIQTFMENQTMWDNFLLNVKDYLKPGGFMVVTAFDADRILKLFEKTDHYIAHYTDTSGEQQTLFEIVKKFDQLPKEIGIGIPFDFHNSLEFQEGVYMTEYLVQKQFIEKEFLEKCNMELVETDLFENQFIINKDYFADTYKYEDNEKTRQFLANAAEYYSLKTEVNSACLKLTRLYRYYIFRKNETGTSGKKSQKGGNLPNELTLHDYIFNDAIGLLNPSKFVKRNIPDSGNYSFMYSVCDVLKNSGIIPKNITPNEFYNDISIKMFKDGNMNQNSVNKLAGNLSIKHGYDSSMDLSSEVALNGMNIIVIEKDCDGSNVVTKYGKGGRVSKIAPTSIIYYDGSRYYPIYKVKKNKMFGLFDTNKVFIKNVLKYE